MAAVVALAVTLGTGGAGGFAAGVVESLGFTGAQMVIMQAGVQAICAQTAVAFLSNDFNPVRAVTSLKQKQAYTSILQSMATAGILDKLIPYGLTDDPKSWLNHLNKSAINSGVNASLNMAIHGEKPEAALKHALISTLALTAGGVMANRIGEAYNDASPGMNYVTHKLAHGLLGAAVGGILSEGKAEGFIAGALGGAMSEMIAEEMQGDSEQVREDISRYEEENGIKLNKEDFQKEFHERMGTSTAMKAGKIGAAIVALLAEQNVSISVETATNAVENNFALQVAQLGLLAWEAKEIYDIYQAHGMEAAFEHAMWVGAGMATGAVALKYAGRAAAILGPKAELILNACRKFSPKFDKAYTKMMSMTSKVIDQVRYVDALVDTALMDLAKKSLNITPLKHILTPITVGVLDKAVLKETAALLTPQTAMNETLSQTGIKAAEKYVAMVESKTTGTYTEKALTLADVESSSLNKLAKNNIGLNQQTHKKFAKDLSDQDFIQKMVNKADQAIPGKGPVVGTKKHRYSERLGKTYQKHMNEKKNLQFEVPFKDGSKYEPGTGVGKKGSVKVDVYNRDANTVWDHKFGDAKLRWNQFNRIQNNLPKTEGNPVTVIEIKPTPKI